MLKLILHAIFFKSDKNTISKGTITSLIGTSLAIFLELKALYYQNHFAKANVKFYSTVNLALSYTFT